MTGVKRIMSIIILKNNFGGGGGGAGMVGDSSGLHETLFIFLNISSRPSYEYCQDHL